MVPTPEFTRGTINKYKLDITQYWNQIQAKGGNLYIQVVDYAKNSAGYYLSLNDTVAEIESISFKEIHRYGRRRQSDLPRLFHPSQRSDRFGTLFDR